MKKVCLLICLAVFAVIQVSCKEGRLVPELGASANHAFDESNDQTGGQEYPADQFKSDAVIHYFGSPVCPACRIAEAFFESAEGKSRIANAEVVSYELVGDRGNINAGNMNALIEMLDSINEKTGSKPFVYREGKLYEYYKKNGIPYHRRDDVYSGMGIPFPLPVFIVNKSVYLGFGEDVIRRLAGDVRD